MKSVVIHYRLEVVDFDKKIDKRVREDWFNNNLVFPAEIRELPDVDLNIARQYRYPSEMDRLSARIADESAIAIMESKKEEGEPIPYCIFLNPVKTL